MDPFLGERTSPRICWCYRAVFFFRIWTPEMAGFPLGFFLKTSKKRRALEQKETRHPKGFLKARSARRAPAAVPLAAQTAVPLLARLGRKSLGSPVGCLGYHPSPPKHSARKRPEERKHSRESLGCFEQLWNKFIGWLPELFQQDYIIPARSCLTSILLDQAWLGLAII